MLSSSSSSSSTTYSSSSSSSCTTAGTGSGKGAGRAGALLFGGIAGAATFGRALEYTEEPKFARAAFAYAFAGGGAARDFPWALLSAVLWILDGDALALIATCSFALGFAAFQPFSQAHELLELRHALQQRVALVRRQRARRGRVGQERARHGGSTTWRPTRDGPSPGRGLMTKERGDPDLTRIRLAALIHTRRRAPVARARR